VSHEHKNLENYEVESELLEFCRFHTLDSEAQIEDLKPLPGHAGLSYSFRLVDRRQSRNLVLRLAPRGVRAAGPADVVRQGRIMASLNATGLPVPRVLWFGDDLRWFGRPYCIVELVEGSSLARGDQILTSPDRDARIEAVLRVMVTLHKLDWREMVQSWGPVVSTEAELARIDGLLERPTLDYGLVRSLAPLGEQLRKTLAGDGPVGCVHGDFQWTNLLFDGPRVAALLDWELAMIGPTTLDLAWLCLFSDPESWATDILIPKFAPAPEELVALYEELSAEPVNERVVRWFRAFSAYRFGAITVFNLMLHRRGKRVDPVWEILASSVPRMVERALELCASISSC